MRIKNIRKEKSLRLRYREQFEEVEKILDKEFEGPAYRGKCHAVWDRKKQLLKEMYDIDWKSPAELNPHIDFD